MGILSSQEKIDLFEEHIAQLMVDIKKKNRIIQAYYMKMEPGDLISEETELHKVNDNMKHFLQNLLLNVFPCLGPGESQHWDNVESVQQ